MNAPPIWAAYAGARDIPCPTCGAEPASWCTRGDGRVGRVPCIARLAAAEHPESDDDSPTDFSEARHPPRPIHPARASAPPNRQESLP